jgi:hypothetical protein
MSERKRIINHPLEKMEYAIDLIEGFSEKEEPPMQIVIMALTVMEFGGITPRQMLNYLEGRDGK